MLRCSTIREQEADTPEPLNYRNAKGPKPVEPVATRPLAPRVAIPAEFDTLLTRTEDLAAAAAIAKLLTEQKISFFHTHDGQATSRTVEIYVKPADQPRAGELAAAIFVRRKKFKAMPRPEMPQMPGSSSIARFPPLPGEW
jgi:hypothetical protein